MLSRLLSRLTSFLCPYLNMRSGVRFGSQARLLGWPLIRCHAGSSIVIGDRTVVCSKPTETALGVRQPAIFRTLRPQASISIGYDCGLSGTTIVAASRIQIDDGCLLGAHVIIVDTDFHTVESLNRRYETPDWDAISAPVHIARNVFLGVGVIVTKGVSIGENSVIGAGSLVCRDIPANVIAGGNPCRVIAPLGIDGIEQKSTASARTRIATRSQPRP